MKSLPPLPVLPIQTYQKGAREQLQELYTDAQAHPDRADAVGTLGMALEANMQYESALACYRRAQGLEPTSIRWLYYMAVVQSHLGKNAEAAAAMRQVLTLDQNNRPAAIRLGDYLTAMGDTAGSVAVYQDLLRRYPLRTAAAYCGMGHAYAARGEWKMAIEAYEKACKNYPAYGVAHYGLASAYRVTGVRAEAERHLKLYQRYKSNHPDEDDPLMKEVDRYNQSFARYASDGYELSRQGKLAEAARAYEHALTLNPKHVESHVTLAHLYQNMGRFDLATQHSRAAMTLRPKDANAHYNYGVLLYRQKRYSQAAAEFQRAVTIQPSFADALNNLGFMEETTGKLDQALMHYRLAVKYRPEYPLAHYHLGMLLVKQRHYPEGITEMVQSLTPDSPATPTFLLGIAQACAQAGQRDGALRYAKQAEQRAIAYSQPDLASKARSALQQLSSGGRNR